MRTLSFSLGLLGLGLLASCSSDKTNTTAVDDKVLLNTNFDNLVGWVDNKGGFLTTRYAHSGRYSLTIGGGPDFGLTFGAPLGQLTATKPRKLELSGWVRVEEYNTPAQIVVCVSKPDGGEPVFWKSVSMANGTKLNEWRKLKANIVLPNEITNEQIFTVYLWGNKAGKPVYVDDIVVTNAE